MKPAAEDQTILTQMLYSRKEVTCWRTVEQKCEEHSTHKHGSPHETSWTSYLHHQRQTTVKKRWQRGGGGALLPIQLGHFLQVDTDALTVKQHKVNVFQGGAGGGYKVVGDGLEDELSRRLLGKSIPSCRQ